MQGADDWRPVPVGGAGRRVDRGGWPRCRGDEDFGGAVTVGDAGSRYRQTVPAAGAAKAANASLR